MLGYFLSNPDNLAWPTILLWLIPLLGILLVLLIALLTWRHRTRHKREVRRVLKAIGTEVASDILVPDGMGGQIHIDHLLLTARGLLVLDIKDVGGVIFGSDRMDEWAVIDGERRYTFRNPQSALYDRVAAVKSLARDVPVSGRIGFTSSGQFTKGMPKAVVMLDALDKEFGRFGESSSITNAFYPHWQRVLRATTRA
ncbi:MAG: NERD domain-containing protein [Gammaproteobacteria bacterium]|nr:NERD domain-containing protein [Gammaproteobacteria bacterium]